MSFDFGAPELVVDALQVANDPQWFVFIWPLPGWQSYSLMKAFINKYTAPWPSSR